MARARGEGYWGRQDESLFPWMLGTTWYRIMLWDVFVFGSNVHGWIGFSKIASKGKRNIPESKRTKSWVFLTHSSSVFWPNFLRVFFGGALYVLHLWHIRWTRTLYSRTFGIFLKRGLPEGKLGEATRRKKMHFKRVGYPRFAGIYET